MERAEEILVSGPELQETRSCLLIRASEPFSPVTHRAELYPSDRVPQLVQWWRPAHNSHHIRHNQQDPPCYSRLGWKADLQQRLNSEQEKHSWQRVLRTILEEFSLRQSAVIKHKDTQ